MTRTRPNRLADVPSLPQFGYYRRVIVPAYAEYGGHESDELAHRHIKAGFFDMRPDDPRLPSMADMTREECCRFLEYALRQAAEMSLVIESPRPRRDMGRL